MTYDEYFTREAEKTKPMYDAQLGILHNARDKEIAALEAQKNLHLKELADNKDKAQQQAYVQREISKRDLPQYLSRLGINGGMSESAAMDIGKGYRNTFSAANSEYGKNYTNYNAQYDTNVSGLRSNYDKQELDLFNQNQAQARQNAQYAYSTALQQEQIDEDNRRWQAEFDRQAEENERARTQSSSGGSSSGGSSSGGKKNKKHVVDTQYEQVGSTGVKKIVTYSDGTQSATYNYGQ